MISWSFCVIFSALTVILASPTYASVDSHRANGESAEETKLYSNYIYVHAIFMAITFLFLIPSAIFASRFARFVINRKWFAVSFQSTVPFQAELLNTVCRLTQPLTG